MSLLNNYEEALKTLSTSSQTTTNVVETNYTTFTVIDRIINIPLNTIITIKGDSNSRTIRFNFNRYFDGVDLSTKTIHVCYTNADGKSDFSTITSSILTDAYLTFLWIIPSEVSVSAGNVLFKVEFFDISEINEIYRWQTNVASFTVYDAIKAGSNANASNYSYQLNFIRQNDNDTKYDLINSFSEPITVSNKELIISNTFDKNIMQYDSRSRIIPFKMNRYYDNVDISTKTLCIKFKRSDGKTGRSSICNITVGENEIMFGWLVTSEVTYVSGQLLIAIEVIGYDELNSIYILSTKENALNIDKCLQIDGTIEEPEPSWLVTWEIEADKKIKDAENKFIELNQQVLGTTNDLLSKYNNANNDLKTQIEQSINNANSSNQQNTKLINDTVNEINNNVNTLFLNANDVISNATMAIDNANNATERANLAAINAENIAISKTGINDSFNSNTESWSGNKSENMLKLKASYEDIESNKTGEFFSLNPEFDTYLEILKIEGSTIIMKQNTGAEISPTNIATFNHSKNFDIGICGNNYFNKFLNNQTISGITMTVQNGTIILNGTSTAVVTFNLYTPSSSITQMVLSGTYTLSTNNDTINPQVAVRLLKDGSTSSYIETNCSIINKSQTFLLTNANITNFVIRVGSGQTLTNFTLKPQLECSSVQSNYSPYNGIKYNMQYELGNPIGTVKNTIEKGLDGKWKYVKRYGQTTLTATGNIVDAKNNGLCISTVSQLSNLTGTVYNMPSGATTATVYYELANPVETIIPDMYFSINKGLVNYYTTSIPQVVSIVNVKSRLWTDSYKKDLRIAKLEAAIVLLGGII